ncbi:2-oxo-4-hydroxy-4-carboxy-5-ureidoimidazoline decarboxylase [Streptomyces sp. NPDC026672]|uniref:2-oxo-4-hydroxy-4-carboxy-5-ureidoimidazoline decarboxylase n=1 Tax=unclassified Streptomyces TaxID=2593676 RepID=UPI0033FFA94D
MTSTPTPQGLARFNALTEPAARAALHEVCASTAWTRRLLAGRPYATPDDLYATADAATAALTPDDLAEAMAGHPPIGRPKPGDPASAREQRGMSGAPARLRAEMLELNLAYQERFGHVFLICATGLTAERMRDAAQERIGNPPAREREIVRTELGKINRIRLARLVAEDRHTMSTGTTASVSTHILDTSVGRPAAGVSVRLAARAGHDAGWRELGAATTDTDGRCKDLPVPPEGTTHVRLVFAVGPYFENSAKQQADPQQADPQQDAPANRDGGAVFFPEVTVVFAVAPGEHHHVPLLLTPFGYSVYRGS